MRDCHILLPEIDKNYAIYNDHAILWVSICMCEIPDINQSYERTVWGGGSIWGDTPENSPPKNGGLQSGYPCANSELKQKCIQSY